MTLYALNRPNIDPKIVFESGDKLITLNLKYKKKTKDYGRSSKQQKIIRRKPIMGS